MWMEDERVFFNTVLLFFSSGCFPKSGNQLLEPTIGFPTSRNQAAHAATQRRRSHDPTCPCAPELDTRCTVEMVTWLGS